MRTVATAAVLALTLCVGACAGPREQQFTRTDADAVRKASSDLTAAFNAKDVKAILAMYADNSVFMPPNAPTLRGPEPLKSYYDALIKKGATALRLDVDQVSGHGPIAYESGSYSVDYEGNGPPGHDRGKYLRVLRNMNGHWRVEYTIWNSDLPPPAPAPAN